MKKNVLIIFGGQSPEHEVSLKSAASVIKNIDVEKYNVYKIGITKDGRWLLTDATPEQIENNTWQELLNKTAVINPQRTQANVLIFTKEGVEGIKIDVCFGVLHGENGEDGRLQGLLELAGIKYVGPNARASANCMDKMTTKIILQNAGILQADYVGIIKYDYLKNKDEIINEIESKFEYPVFVKPSGTGSSVGVSKAKDRKQLKEAISNALKYDSRVLVEECIIGREVEIAVLGNEEPLASVCGEIIACNEFYDYEAKYEAESKLIIPADIPCYEELKNTALKAYKAMGCEGMARIDFFVRGNEAILNEINTIPGFTSISMYSKMFEKTGISYSELIDRLFELAIERQ